MTDEMSSGEAEEPRTPVGRALAAIRGDGRFWPRSVGAVRATEGMDTDFPEGGDGPIRRHHEANAELRARAVRIEPRLQDHLFLTGHVIDLAEQQALEDD